MRDSERSKYARYRRYSDSEVAVDNADNDDDGHTRDDGCGENQPAVLERSRNNVS